MYVQPNPAYDKMTPSQKWNFQMVMFGVAVVGFTAYTIWHKKTQGHYAGIQPAYQPLLGGR